jgi:hypothetical protein
MLLLLSFLEDSVRSILGQASVVFYQRCIFQFYLNKCHAEMSLGKVAYFNHSVIAAATFPLQQRYIIPALDLLLHHEFTLL